MRIVKSCKKEHNIALGHNELWVGSFAYYRNADPNFSIADYQEGLTEIELDLDTESISHEQFNNVFGGTGVAFGANPPREPLIEKSEIKFTNSTFELSPGKVNLTTKDTQKIWCQNSLMLSFSIEESDTDKINPKDVSEDYDSRYSIEQANIDAFIKSVTKLIIEQITLSYINLSMFKDKHISQLSGAIQCIPIAREVEYVPDKKVILRNAQDFERNKIRDLIISGMFRKNIDYKADKELRILFPLVHQQLGPLSVIEDEHLKLKINPISDYLSS